MVKLSRLNLTLMYVLSLIAAIVIWHLNVTRPREKNDSAPAQAATPVIQLASARAETLESGDLEKFIGSLPNSNQYAEEFQKFGPPPAERGTNLVSLTFIRNGETSVVHAASVELTVKYFTDEKGNKIPLDDAVSVIIIQKGGGQ